MAAKNKPPSYETRELREFAEVLRGRRTINLYLQTKIPKDLVLDAIEAATWAPNHHVTEPWTFYLMGPESIEKCLDLCHEIVSAKKGADAADFKRANWAEKPGWLVVTCEKSDDKVLQQEDYASCSAAVQNLMLYLWQADIGSKWTTGPITRHPRFADIVGFDPDHEFVVGLIWYGYPKLTPTQSRKPVDEVLRHLP
ncbi:MAG: nitroreductase [Woeseiaceae bacterium]|nr:nitroreductase [Woeseiaceae bacterium]